jgi:hypothetical protein
MTSLGMSVAVGAEMGSEQTYRRSTAADSAHTGIGCRGLLVTVAGSTWRRRGEPDAVKALVST